MNFLYKTSRELAPLRIEVEGRIELLRGGDAIYRVSEAGIMTDRMQPPELYWQQGEGSYQVMARYGKAIATLTTVEESQAYLTTHTLSVPRVLTTLAVIVAAIFGAYAT